VLEGNNTRREASYYVSVDRSGQVREILPLRISVERADDSARRQILKWKFKAVMRGGVPVQADAIRNFHFDTRAYGHTITCSDFSRFIHNVPAGTFCPSRADALSPHPLQSWINLLRFHAL